MSSRIWGWRGEVWGKAISPFGIPFLKFYMSICTHIFILFQLKLLSEFMKERFLVIDFLELWLKLFDLNLQNNPFPLIQGNFFHLKKNVFLPIYFFILYFTVHCERDFLVHPIHELYLYFLWMFLFFLELFVYFTSLKHLFLTFNFISVFLISRVIFLYILFIFHGGQKILTIFWNFQFSTFFSDSCNRSV